MKKIILLALTALMMVGCYDNGDSLQSSSYSYTTVTFDSCEYVIGNFTERMAHKGNCRFCKERRQKESEELVIKLKGGITMITEDYVSFETAKLLKEKGFNEPTLAYAYNSDMMNYYSKPRVTDPLSIEAGKIPMPTLQMAMKWLRKVHNLHVDSSIYTDTDGDSEHEYTYTYWDWLIFNSESGRRIAEPQIGCGRYDSYEQACEAAIKYCLENLI